MSTAPHNDPNPRRLYRDTEHGMLAGVCAGIADYFGISVRALRWLTALGCFFMLPPIVICYVLAAFLLPRKPVGLYRNADEEMFWRTVRRDPHYAFDNIRRKFRDLDTRLQGMEQYVTSPRFDLDEEFRRL